MPQFGEFYMIEDAGGGQVALRQWAPYNAGGGYCENNNEVLNGGYVRCSYNTRTITDKAKFVIETILKTKFGWKIAIKANNGKYCHRDKGRQPEPEYAL